VDSRTTANRRGGIHHHPEAADRYLRARTADGIAKATLSHAKMDLARFTKQFGDRTLSIPPDDIRTWIAALPFSEVTKRNHFKRVRAFYTWLGSNA